MTDARVRFGPWLFDTAARQLTSQGRTHHLTPKAFELLRALLEARPRALSKQEIRDLVWPDTFVSDASLNRLVAELREALGDDPREPRFIRTVFGFGYAFCGEQPPERPSEGHDWSLAGTLSIGGRSFELLPGENVIGRGRECLVRLALPRVSRRHAVVRLEGGAATIEDLGSKNGTIVAGLAIREPRTLRDGDEIEIAGVTIKFEISHPSDPTLDGLEKAPD
jgi:DNA-binding winged helix-turn-helix (wHTH) protein